MSMTDRPKPTTADTLRPTPKTPSKELTDESGDFSPSKADPVFFVASATFWMPSGTSMPMAFSFSTASCACEDTRRSSLSVSLDTPPMSSMAFAVSVAS